MKESRFLHDNVQVIDPSISLQIDRSTRTQTLAATVASQPLEERLYHFLCQLRVHRRESTHVRGLIIVRTNDRGLCHQASLVRED